MFTGIIEEMAEIKGTTKTQLAVERPISFDDIKVGSSIAVCGVCLSVTKFDETSMTFNVIPETFKCTKLGSLKNGDKVNLERSLKASDRFEGHVVQGHVESVGCVVSPSSNPSIPRPLPPREEGENKEDFFIEDEKWKKNPIPPNIRFFAREMRKKPTKAECVLWEHVRHDQLGVRFRRQYYMDGCIFDFFCPKLRLAIELDGPTHSTSFKKRDDTERDEYFNEERGIRTLRFLNEEILNDINTVINKIQQAINSSPPPVEEGLGVEGELGLESKEITITVPEVLLKYIAPKGSISLDGVSLTVVSIEGNSVTVALIPYTLEQTTLGVLKDGDKVNIETDVMAKHAHQLLLSTT